MREDNTTSSELLLYQTEDGRTRIDCRFEDETVWLTQKLMAELFQVTPQSITMHLKAIYAEGELAEAATCKELLQVQTEGKRRVSRNVRHYRLEVILAVGYRVRSHRGTQFRQWATARLSEYLVKGFTMDDERLMNPPGRGQVDYFDELLERIRAIRASERRFYQKVLDIYATSVDYDPRTDQSRQFFATVQNKMHFATHGRTAAEVIAERVDADAPLMGMQTTRPGGIIRKADISVAKNYLTQDELEVLRRIVNAYLEFAELQAMDRKPMTMQGWIDKLDDFLRMSGRELLDHAGKVSADAARAKAEREYQRYRAIEDARPRAVDDAFVRAVKRLKVEDE
ncbi:MAG: virulence RhuM family protein [Myxococcales bacterium]|nr:virulence RhuM family protein [Myxococcales bacterium]